MQKKQKVNKHTKQTYYKHSTKTQEKNLRNVERHTFLEICNVVDLQP
jgi:hypothetical protein